MADLVTPVGVYLSVRDEFPNSVLLESSDYNSAENASSFIGIEPLAGISVYNGKIYERIYGKEEITEITFQGQVIQALQNFVTKFDLQNKHAVEKSNAIFGYIAYDAVRYFESIVFQKKESVDIPDLQFSLYKYIIEFKHFHNKIYLIELLQENEDSQLEMIKRFLQTRFLPRFSFQRIGGEVTNMKDIDFLNIVERCKKHCRRGDVFQIVPSRRYIQAYAGDDFKLYRALRSINPSPYQFYFDYGRFRLLGSSPEAQLQIVNGSAYIHPIAGTFRRTGDETQDRISAEKLKKDEKENAEHTMLVDLARNDLSRNGSDIKVENFSEIQYFSHVIHLVSKVSAKINMTENTFFKIVADTFPAGTLSGAPKYRAMELIDEMEPTARTFYGGGIGCISFNNEINLAIMIRSFLSKNNYLYFQAGAGIVEKSDAYSELNEVNNKLAALRRAFEIAES